eukprot:Gregarina_sp_Poly_1__724@NODE_1172_length_4867_cov_127_976875_g803_i0_p3_GENE_NODE_1172_length_4867_cov_127_976875_g803_i0NODE_1172_length_4867_cov_127_976875_g803_i0_p3_ORF_typecomplete_len273_score33_18_NODE_1172_length_4867_cov_127_976875_g803_i013952213
MQQAPVLQITIFCVMFACLNFPTLDTETPSTNMLLRFPVILLCIHHVIAAVFWDSLAREESNVPKQQGTSHKQRYSYVDEQPNLIGQAEIRFKMGDIDFRAEPDALLQIVERIGTIKKGIALYRTTNELSTAFTSNLLLTSVVGHAGSQYLVRALSAAKHDVRISIAGVDGTIRLLIHDYDTYKEELASFGKLLPIWQAIDMGYLCESALLHEDLKESTKSVLEHIISLVDAKLHVVNATSAIRLERDIVKMLRAIRKPAETVARGLQISLP